MSTIGADPEVFIRDTRTGTAVPICGLLGGTKEAPLPLGDLGEGYAVQEDNVMAEFNIPPARKAGQFARSVQMGLSAVRDLVRTRSEHLDLDFAPTRLFAHEALRTKQARLFGCSPDFNAYSEGGAYRTINPLQLEEQDGAWRFAGGHVHLGYDKTDKTPPPFVVARLADVYIGLPAVGLDEQGKRRDLYGQAGRFRATEYGIEYRTLSNFWIFDRALSEGVGRRALRLTQMLEGDLEQLQAAYQEIPWADVQEAINKEDAGMAADLIAFITHDLSLSGVV